MTQLSLKMIKFTFAMVSAIVLVKFSKLPFPYLFPLLVGHFLLFELDKQTAHVYANIVKVICKGALLACVCVLLAQLSELLYSLLLPLLFFNLTYHYQKEQDELSAIFHIIAIALFPLVALSSEIIVPFMSSFFLSALLALLYVWLCNYVMPIELELKHQTTKHQPKLTSPLISAVMSTLIIIPVIFITFNYQYYSAFLVLCYCAFIALHPQLINTKKSAIHFVYGNLIGGGLAMLSVAVWFFLAPYFLHSLALITCIASVFTSIFSYLLYKSRLGQIAIYAISPFIIISFDLGDNFFQVLPSYMERVIFIVTAVTYTLAMIWLSELYLGRVNRQS